MRPWTLVFAFLPSCGGAISIAIDASTDGSSNAYAKPLDASVVDVSVPVTCARYPKAVFCADFDKVKTFDQDWTSYSLAPLDASSFGLDMSTYVSPPHGLRSYVIGFSGSGAGPQGTLT